MMYKNIKNLLEYKKKVAKFTTRNKNYTKC